MKSIAALSLPDTARFTSLDFSVDGEAVLLGTNTLEGAVHTLGVLWVDLGSPATAGGRAVPRSALPAGIDASAAPIDVDGDRAVVVTSTSSLYGPQHDQVWLVSRTARVGPTLLCDAPGAQVALFLSANRRTLLMSNGTSLEHVTLDSDERKVIDVEVDRAVRSIALNPEGLHVALAGHDRVACHVIDGDCIGTWPTPGRLFGLRFADDDLGLWGIGHEAVLQFPIGGAVIPWTVPGRRPISAHGRLALFGGKAGFCTLDLSSGAVTELGTIDAPMEGFCWSAARRRLAIFGHEDATPMLRVFQY